MVIVSLLLALLAQPVPAGGPQRVECAGTGDAKGREFVLARPAAGAAWRLSYRDADHPAWIHLDLEGAEPVFGDDSARLQFRNANGGRQIDLDVRPDAAPRLDVYVDYGLEVNVDADLDPDIDRMNTEGPLRVECRVARSAP